MATGIQREVRRIILSTLKANATVAASVPVTSIFGQTVPAEPVWPFIKLGSPQTLPSRSTCVRGGIVNLAVHAFAKAKYTNGAMVMTAEDHASIIGAAIEGALDCKAFASPIGQIRIRMKDYTLIVDGADADAFHYIAVAEARVIAE